MTTKTLDTYEEDAVRPVRVLMVSFYTPPMIGGAEKQALLIASGLKNSFASSARLVGAKLPGLKSHDMWESAPIARLTCWPWRRGLRQLIALPGYLIALFWYLVSRRAAYDVVHVGAFDISVLSVGLASAVTRRPFVVRYASMLDAQILRTTLIGRCGWRLMFRARCFVVNSETVGAHLRDDHKVPREEIVLIHNALVRRAPARSRDEVRRELGLPLDATVFVNISSFYMVKNQHMLIELWRKLRDRGDAFLLLVGDGPTLSQCRYLANEVASNRIFFVGRRSDVPDLLHASDVFLFPSCSEGLSNALLEAMDAALPCIASDIPQNTVVVEDGVTGITFRVNDQADLERVVDLVFEKSVVIKELGNAARRRVQSEFTLDVAVQRHLETFNRARGN